MVWDIARYNLATLLRNVLAEGKPSPRELEGMQENQ